MYLYHLFVYGTLKPGQRYYDSMCAPYVVEQRPAIAPGRLYDLPLGYPAMTLEEGWIVGVRLSLTDSAVLARLDEFEAYYPHLPLGESEYQRLEHPLFTLEGSPLGTAWAYVMPLERVQQMRGVWLPGGEWGSDSLS